MRTIIKTATVTSLLWLLVIGYGSLYALFHGVEIRLPAATVEAQQISDIFDVADNTSLPPLKHRAKK